MCIYIVLKIFNKISLVRPHEIKTTPPLRQVFAYTRWYFPYDIKFDNKTTPLIRSLLGSLKVGLNKAILLLLIKSER